MRLWGARPRHRVPGRSRSRSRSNTSSCYYGEYFFTSRHDCLSRLSPYKVRLFIMSGSKISFDECNFSCTWPLNLKSNLDISFWFYFTIRHCCIDIRRWFAQSWECLLLTPKMLIIINNFAFWHGRLSDKLIGDCSNKPLGLLFSVFDILFQNI